MSNSPLLPDGPDSLTLAAYLDGRLDDATRDRVEAWLAADPDRLDVLLGSQDALAAGSGPAPEALIARAKALAADGAGDAGRAPVGGAADPTLWSRLYWPSAVAATVLACFLGFQLGQAGAVPDLWADSDLLALADEDPIGELALDLTDVGLPI